MSLEKHPGKYDDRISLSTRPVANQRAPNITCNICDAALANVKEFDASVLKGIGAAFSAHCAVCEQDTWAIRGEPAAVKAFYAALEKAVGGKVTLGTAKNPDLN